MLSPPLPSGSQGRFFPNITPSRVLCSLSQGQRELSVPPLAEHGAYAHRGEEVMNLPLSAHKVWGDARRGGEGLAHRERIGVRCMREEGCPFRQVVISGGRRADHAIYSRTQKPSADQP